MSAKEKALDHLQRRLLQKYGSEAFDIVKHEVDGLRSQEKLTGEDLEALEKKLKNRTKKVSRSLGRLRRIIPYLKSKDLRAVELTPDFQSRFSSNSPDKVTIRRPSSLTKSARKSNYASTSRPFSLRNRLDFSRVVEDHWGVALQHNALLHKPQGDIEAQTRVMHRKSYGAFLHKQARERAEKELSPITVDKQQDKERLLRLSRKFQRTKDVGLNTKTSARIRCQTSMNESIQKTIEKTDRLLDKRVEIEEVSLKFDAYREERERAKTVLRQNSSTVRSERAFKREESREARKLEKLGDKNEILRLLKLFDEQVEAQEEQRKQEEAQRASRTKAILQTTLLSRRGYEDLIKEGEAKAERERQRQEEEYKTRFFSKSKREQEVYDDRLLTRQKQLLEKISPDLLSPVAQKEQEEIWNATDGAYIEATKQPPEKDLKTMRENTKLLRSHIAEKELKKCEEADSPTEKKQSKQFFMTLGLAAPIEI